MKRIRTAMWIVVAMVLLCGVLLRSTTLTVHRLNQHIEQLCAVEDGSEEGKQLTRELKEMWERQERIMALHIRHSELEEVTLALTRIEYNWQAGEYGMFRVACGEAKAAVDHLREESLPSFKNII